MLDLAPGRRPRRLSRHRRSAPAQPRRRVPRRRRQWPRPRREEHHPLELARSPPALLRRRLGLRWRLGRGRRIEHLRRRLLSGVACRRRVGVGGRLLARIAATGTQLAQSREEDSPMALGSGRTPPALGLCRRRFDGGLRVAGHTSGRRLGERRGAYFGRGLSRRRVNRVGLRGGCGRLRLQRGLRLRRRVDRTRLERRLVRQRSGRPGLDGGSRGRRRAGRRRGRDIGLC